MFHLNQRFLNCDPQWHSKKGHNVVWTRVKIPYVASFILIVDSDPQVLTNIQPMYLWNLIEN